MSSDIDKEWGDTVIKVEHVSKCFRMYSRQLHRLQQFFFGRFHKWYKEFWALKDVSFEIKRGECVGLIGRNGSGKSTILQIITGTLQPTEGRAVIKPGLRVAALLELGSGFNPEFTGRENVYLNATILGLSREETSSAFPEIEKFAEIGEFIDQPVKNYSSGMMVRLAFAVQVMIHPDILIVDEALAVGDAFFQQKCFQRIHDLKEHGCTILFVSHDNMAVRSLCDRAVLLKNGSIVDFGPTDRVCALYFKSGLLTGDSTKEFAQKQAKSLSFSTIMTAVKRSFHDDPEMKQRASEISGDGDVEFTALDFYDETGDKINFCETGDIVTAAVSFRSKKDLPEGACLGVLAQSNKGVPIFLLNNYIYELKLPALKAGENYVMEFEFKIPLQRGRYFFNLSLKPFDSTEYYYAHVKNGALLEVEFPESIKRFAIPGFIFLHDVKRIACSAVSIQNGEKSQKL